MLYGSQEVLTLKEYLAKKPFSVWFIIFLLTSIGLGFGFTGIYQLFSTNDQEIVSSNEIEAQVCTQKPDFDDLTVYISGGVVNPGVYVFQDGDRVTDLLQAAGGIHKTADKEYVSKQFNLAEKLVDGSQFYIPLIEEVTAELEKNLEPVGGLSEEISENTSVTNEISNSPISINSSPKEALMQLSGIGEVKATKIIENRPYGSTEELVQKKVVSQNMFEDIKKLITL